QLTISLTSGDLDSDGKDELAVAAGVNRMDGVTDENILHHGTYVSVFNKEGAAFNKAGQSMKLMDEMVASGTSASDITKGYNSIYGASISAGDIDNDDCDELVIGGYLSKPTMRRAGNLSTKTSDYKYVDTITSGKIGAAIVSFVPNANYYANAPIQEMTANAFTTDGLYISTDYAWPRLAVTCAAINGIKGEEYVFISGTLYTTKKGTTLAELYTPEYFQSADNGAGSQALSNTCVESAIAGNFDGNEYGREQLVYTVALKADGAKTYYLGAGTMGGYNYGEDGGVASGYFSDDLNSVQYQRAQHGEPRGSNLACVPIAVDVDYDGALARLSKTNYIYTDPQVEAVLQAAPYFSELENHPGETSYAFTTSYNFTSTETKNVSFAVGFSGDLEIASFKASLDAGYDLEWSESYEQSKETFQSTTFTAKAYDSVVMLRTLTYLYFYDVYDNETNQWVKDASVMNVPQDPAYIQLSLEDYNSFVEYYNNMIKENDKPVFLNKITDRDMPVNNEGNPFAYYGSISEAGQGAEKLSKGNSYSMGNNGATTTSEWGASSSSTVGNETAHGFH
ncbi:MAG: hypothetical protein RR396_04685, partial [Clostridiales bacterium]